eukprot:398039-Rhodomonas_salina.1
MLPGRKARGGAEDRGRTGAYLPPICSYALATRCPDEEAVPPVLVKDEAKEEAKKEEDKKEEKKEEDDDGTTPASWEEEEEEDVGGGAELAAAVPISCSPVEGGVIQSSSLVTV